MSKKQKQIFLNQISKFVKIRLYIVQTNIIKKHKHEF